MTIVVIDSTRDYFLISTNQILWEKVLKMKVEASDIFGVKINQFLFRKKFLLFHFGVKISEKFFLLFTSQVSHYAIWYKDKCIK